MSTSSFLLTWRRRNACDSFESSALSLILRGLVLRQNSYHHRLAEDLIDNLLRNQPAGLDLSVRALVERAARVQQLARRRAGICRAVEQRPSRRLAGALDRLVRRHLQPEHPTGIEHRLQVLAPARRSAPRRHDR